VSDPAQRPRPGLNRSLVPTQRPCCIPSARIGHGGYVTSAERTDPRSGIGRRAVRWMLANRRTGRLTVTQWPNIPLSVFIVLTFLVHILHPRGAADDLAHVLADVALIAWAADEVVRGVNPFRRILGVAVIITTIASLTF
jgi:hypothetical protein